MSKFFFPPNALEKNCCTLIGDTAHHMLHVLRMKPGAYAILCDGKGMDYKAVLTESNPKGPTAVFSVLESTPCQTESKVSVTLYQSLPKGDKMEWIIQKCVELGIYKIVPICTARTVVRIKDAEKKTTRYQRIAEGAAAQSMRGIIPEVSSPLPFCKALDKKGQEDIWIAAWENENNRSIASVLQGSPPKSIGLWIGPEGGFETDEIAALQVSGAIPITLGRRILRTETASMAGLIQILCVWEAL